MTRSQAIGGIGILAIVGGATWVHPGFGIICSGILCLWLENEMNQ